MFLYIGALFHHLCRKEVKSSCFQGLKDHQRIQWEYFIFLFPLCVCPWRKWEAWEFWRTSVSHEKRSFPDPAAPAALSFSEGEPATVGHFTADGLFSSLFRRQ